MNIYESITLLGIMVALAAIPSASVALVVARSATLGVANGFAVAAEIMGNLFMILKVLGGLYLLWFGFSLLSTRGMAKITIKKNNSKHSLVASFMAGFFLTLGDIKAIVFYASLLPVFVDLSTIQTPEITVIGLVTIFSVGGVKAVYAIFANKVAACAKRTNMESAARKTAGGLMIGAGGYLIIKA
jgi:threonine/homoserine/homoserine lactone efflux protein